MSNNKSKMIAGSRQQQFLHLALNFGFLVYKYESSDSRRIFTHSM